MNSRTIAPHILRFIGLVAVQSLLLNQMTGSIGAYFNVLLYPLFILFLPLQMAAPYVIMLGFLVGLTVDMFVPSWGIHASAGVFSGFARGLALMPFAPKGGFSAKDPIFSPSLMGWQTFLQGTALFMAMHLLWYFSFSYFSHLYMLEIVKKTASAWVLTMIFVALYTAMFNPKK
jgi:hypothetical protein